MDLYQIAVSLEASGIAVAMRENLQLLPIVNIFHVLSITFFFGTLAIVDLRLLGIPHNNRSIRVISHEMLKWTWIAFVVAVITGILLFLTNATTFYNNNEFRWKMVFIVLAGINMIIFEFFTARSVDKWDKDVPVPTAGKIAGILSLVFWIAVIFFGRWIGYTKGFDFNVPVTDLDLDSFLTF